MALSHSGIKKNALLRTGYSHFKSIRRRVKTATNSNIIQVPGFYFPHSGYTGSLWIEMQPRKLDQINTGGRGGTFRTTDEGPIYRFLAPVEGINETHNHDWQVYESMQAKLLKLINNLEVGVERLGDAASDITSSVFRQVQSGRLPNASDIKRGLLNATAFDKPKVKIDSPLAYENSARRQFIFTFPLLSEGLKTDLIEIVKDIQGFAAPKQSGGSIEIEWPHVWSIQSEPRGVLDVDIAACTSVQVDWLDPYLGGVPQRCNLTIGFTDISPLFSDTIIYGSLVEVNPDQPVQEPYDQQLKNKGTLPKEIKGVIKSVREQLGYPKTNTPINP